MSNNPFLPPPSFDLRQQTNSNNCPGTKYDVTSVDFLSPPGCHKPTPESPLNIPWPWEKTQGRRFGRNFNLDTLKHDANELGKDVTGIGEVFLKDLGVAAQAGSESFKKGGAMVMDGNVIDGMIEIGKAAGKANRRIDKAWRNLDTGTRQLADNWVNNPMNRGLKDMDETHGTTSNFDLNTFIGRGGDYYLDVRFGIDYQLWRETLHLLGNETNDWGILCAVTEGNLFADARFRLSSSKALDQGLDVDLGGSTFAGLEWEIKGDFLGDWGDYVPDGLVLKGGLEQEWRIADGASSNWVIGFTVHL